MNVCEEVVEIPTEKVQRKAASNAFYVKKLLLEKKEGQSVKVADGVVINDANDDLNNDTVFEGDRHPDMTRRKFFSVLFGWFFSRENVVVKFLSFFFVGLPLM